MENDIEELRQYALAQDRAARKEDREVKELKLQVSPPGKVRYYVGFFLSIAGDLLDIVNFILILFFGAGLVLGWAVDLIIDVPLLILGFKSGKELKKTGKAASAITEKIQIIEQKVAQYRHMYALILKTSRKIKILRKPVRQFARKIKNARKIITKSPVGRFVVYIVADIVPGLDLIPFRTIAMRSMYKQEKKSYQEFQLLISEDYREAREEEVEAVNDALALEQGEESTEAEQLAA